MKSTQDLNVLQIEFESIDQHLVILGLWFLGFRVSRVTLHPSFSVNKTRLISKARLICTFGFTVVVLFGAAAGSMNLKGGAHREGDYANRR